MSGVEMEGGSVEDIWFIKLGEGGEPKEGIKERYARIGGLSSGQRGV